MIEVIAWGVNLNGHLLTDRRDAAQRMADAEPADPPSPSIYASETHKDRTAAEEFRESR